MPILIDFVCQLKRICLISDFVIFHFFLENNQFILLTIIVVFFLLFYNALINNCLITLYYIQNYKKYINQIFKKKYIETFKKKEYKKHSYD